MQFNNFEHQLNKFKSLLPSSNFRTNILSLSQQISGMIVHLSTSHLHVISWTLTDDVNIMMRSKAMVRKIKLWPIKNTIIKWVSKAIGVTFSERFNRVLVLFHIFSYCFPLQPNFTSNSDSWLTSSSIFFIVMKVIIKINRYHQFAFHRSYLYNIIKTYSE